MSELTDLEFNIIDELYFVTSFAELESSLNAEREPLLRTLESLITRRLISQLVPDSSGKEYLELDELNSIRLEQSFFVASKRGLLLHNSRH